MIGNIFKLIGVISVALIIGYVYGVNHCNEVSSGTVTKRETATEITTITTDTRTKPDGSSHTKTVTETKRTAENKEDQTVPVKTSLNKNRIQVAVRPEWDKEKKEIKGHPVVGIGHRVWDSPAWVEVGLDIDRKEVTLGVALEW
jgi:hypothetical protein